MARSGKPVRCGRAAIGEIAPILPIFRHLSGLQSIHHLVKLVAEVLANFAPHPPRPTGDAFGVVFVDVAENGWIRELVKSGLF
jgi:hypothetical protein